jgi:hypothetical protein
MATIEDCGMEEFYAKFVSIEGARGSALLLYHDKPLMDLAQELGAVLDAVPAPQKENKP